MKFLYIGAFLFFLVSTYTHAQNVMASSGGHFESSQFQISWTLGEPVVETLESGNICLTQGFHQSILTVTAIDGFPESLVDIKVYPNPVTTKVNLFVQSENFKNWTYSLYNGEGKLLINKEINSSITQIPIQLYVASEYILQVNEGNRNLRSFKIIKSR